MAIDWNTIRSFNNSQNNAFEELVCQLAREEEIVGKEDFYRIAAPDGGVEAYSVLNNGDEYGWQAKYFSSIGSSQWNQIKEFKDAKDNLEFGYLLSQKKGIVQIDIPALEKSISTIENVLSQCERHIDAIKDESKDSNDYTKHAINKLWSALNEFSAFIQGTSIELANYPIALLSGPAGIGKSHLLADITLKKRKENKSCILVLGQHFSSEESPWTQILHNLLRVQCSESELLGALDAKAEAQGERILFIIDAINEGRGKYFWPEYIRGFINEFKKYPWLGLVLSIRSSYDRLLIPDDLISDNKIIRLNHLGFEGVEYYASSFFFAQYGIEQPSVPLLHPEFSNPLFLILFCEGLHRSGLTKIPKGYGGISSIIDFFIESIDNKLSKPSFFDYPPDRKIVRKVIDGLIEYKLKNDLDFVTYEEAFDIADRILSRYSNKRRFLDALISEGVLSKNLLWIKDRRYEEYIYLVYERFEDHLTTSYLLDVHLDSDNHEIIFQNNGQLASYIDNSHLKQGILEALSIQIPERTGKELYELLDERQKAFGSVIESFINSLIWRKTETIKESTKEYVNRYILHNKHTSNLFFQMVYSVSTDPKHLYNADSLHHFLMQFTLAQKDSIWTFYLHDQNREGTAMNRLINWTKSEDEKSYLSEDSRLLAAKALAWLLTSTNILFRDSATKALVILLENNLPTITNLLNAFEEVNDPYVSERVYAAAYGAVLRSDNLNGLEKLSCYIVENFFSKEEVYPNILVRDYARNIVEYAQYKGQINLEGIEIIRPPYKSHFPSEFPTNEEIDSYQFDYSAENFKDYYWGQNEILSSMVTEYGRGVGGYGDFGRYIFESAVRNWDDFDPNDLSNYACQLIFEKCGYDVEKHGRIDRHASRGDRYRNKTERIGKKYQWLALYEVLARLSDNYQMDDDSYGEEKKNYKWYQGPWEPFVRNIDPTVVCCQSKIQFLQENFNKNLDYADWAESNEDWLIKSENLPDPQSLITVTDINKDEWLVLENHPFWEEPVPIGRDKNESPHKRLWYQIRSYLVKEEEMEELLHWLKDQHFMGRWFPEGHEQYQVFSREFYWSPAYCAFNSPVYGEHNWKKVYRNRRGISGEVIADVHPTSEGHRWESEADDEEQPSYLAPSEYIYSGMKLQYSKNIGEWLDEKGKTVCFDISVQTEKPSCLLIRKDMLLKFLAENRLRVFWTCLGEKQILGDSFSRRQHLQWLELSGVYCLYNSNVTGKVNYLIQGVT